jgi:hypothetical protein
MHRQRKRRNITTSDKEKKKPYSRKRMCGNQKMEGGIQHARKGETKMWAARTTQQQTKALRGKRRQVGEFTQQKSTSRISHKSPTRGRQAVGGGGATLFSQPCACVRCYTHSKVCLNRVGRINSLRRTARGKGQQTMKKLYRVFPPLPRLVEQPPQSSW